MRTGLYVLGGAVVGYFAATLPYLLLFGSPDPTSGAESIVALAVYLLGVGGGGYYGWRNARQVQ